MIVPTMIESRFVDENGFLTDEAKLLMQQLLQNMQQNLSQEGYVVPSQDSANIAIIEAGTDEFGTQIALPGTLLFNTSAVNGGSAPAPNGQLYILLQDGTFHPITNT